MVGLVILAYVAVAAFELYLWAERPWKKVVVYLAFCSSRHSRCSAHPEQISKGSRAVRSAAEMDRQAVAGRWQQVREVVPDNQGCLVLLLCCGQHLGVCPGSTGWTRSVAGLLGGHGHSAAHGPIGSSYTQFDGEEIPPLAWNTFWKVAISGSALGYAFSLGG